MVNKKGFTVIEFIVSFSLVTVIMLLLMQLFVGMSSSYTNAFIKTDLIVKQTSILKQINEDFELKRVKNISSRTPKKLEIYFYDNTSKILEVKDDILYYGDIQIKLIQNLKIGNFEFKNKQFSPSVNGEVDSYFQIKLPISYPNIEGDVGINIIKMYNSTNYPVS